MGVDLRQFAPQDPGLARRLLGLPENQPAILFTAADIHDPRKGFADLFHIWQEMTVEERPLLLVAGRGNAPRADQLHHFGSINHPRFLSLLYSGADLLVHPVHADNQPNTVLESFACGTPVATFQTGGMAELVPPSRERGYLLLADKRGELAELLRTMKSRVNHGELNAKGSAARRYVEEKHDHLRQATAYIKALATHAASYRKND